MGERKNAAGTPGPETTVKSRHCLCGEKNTNPIARA
jgi:hypothetical protein